MLVFDLLLQIGHGQLQDMRRGRIAALLVPASIDEADGHFRLRPREAEEAAVFSNMGCARGPHPVQQHIMQLAFADPHHALALL